MKSCFLVVLFWSWFEFCVYGKDVLALYFAPSVFQSCVMMLFFLPLIQLSEISSSLKSVFVIVYIGQQPQCSELEKTNKLESLNSNCQGLVEEQAVREKDQDLAPNSKSNWDIRNSH